MQVAIVTIALLAAAQLSAAQPPAQAALMIEWQAERLVVPGAKGFTVAADGRLLCWATRREEGRINLRVLESRDDGRTFTALPGIVDSDTAGVDLGDASLLAARDGSLWISYRHIHGGERPDYAIKVARSTDNGRTWTRTMVAESAGIRGKPSRGLWASCLFQRSDGVVQCYYDDEDIAFRGGKPQHQWIAMKTWDGSAWSEAVVVSRARDPAKLSRDGMMSVVEVAPMKLLVAFESVSIDRPHENVVRSVTSDDGGATWSWRQREREILYAAPTRPHMAFAPWMAALGGERLICVLVTDEDRAVADVSGTPPHRMNADVKYVTSADAGRTWSASAPIAIDSHRYYLPGVCVRTIDGKAEVLVTYLDFADGKCRLARGRVAP